MNTPNVDNITQHQQSTTNTDTQSHLSPKPKKQKKRINKEKRKNQNTVLNSSSSSIQITSPAASSVSSSSHSSFHNFKAAPWAGVTPTTVPFDTLRHPLRLKHSASGPVSQHNSSTSTSQPQSTTPRYFVMNDNGGMVAVPGPVVPPATTPQQPSPGHSSPQPKRSDHQQSPQEDNQSPTRGRFQSRYSQSSGSAPRRRGPRGYYNRTAPPVFLNEPPWMYNTETGEYILPEHQLSYANKLNCQS